MSQLQAWVRRALWDVVPRDHRAERPRGCAAGSWSRSAFVVLGAVVLGLSLRIDPGSRWFYAADPGPGRRVGRRRVRLRSAAPGPDRVPAGHIPAGGHADRARAAAGRGLRGRRLPGAEPRLPGRPRGPGRQRSSTTPTRARCRCSCVVTAVSGIAEELFFRGAAYAAITGHPVLWTTVAYAVATAATGNVMLTFAALLLGLVVRPRAAGQRRHPRPDPHALHLVADHALRAAARLLLTPDRSSARPARPPRGSDSGSPGTMSWIA